MFSHDVVMQDGTTFRVTRLLAKANANTKTNKSDKTDTGFMTMSLSLAPAKASGYNLCTSASHGCTKGCIFTSGLAGVFPRTIQPSRIAKSRMLRISPVVFRNQLEKEIRAGIKRANHHNMTLAIRLNVFSDIIWEREMPGIFDAFPMVQFYDYTKHYKRMLRYLNNELSVNYHLTFSRSETNERECLDVLSQRGSVAVPFHTKKSKPLPNTFMGRPVVNGDETDLRFLDPQNVIVGLRAKGLGRGDFDTGFIINV